jgi:hypothetical protein
MRLLALVVIVAVGCFGSAEGQSQRDACRAQISESIGRLMIQKFPAYRLPLISDSASDDIQFDIARGGTGCLLVTRGDFNSDKRNDLAVGLVPKTGHVPIVAVALSQGSSWNLSFVDSHVDVIAALYVSRSAPDTFKRTDALDSPLDRDERNILRCRNDALIVGAAESTGIAYCRVNNRWLYVWISD